MKKKIMENRKEKHEWKVCAINTALLAGCGILNVCGNPVYVFAGNGEENFNGFITFLCSWIIKIGCVVALIGGVQMAIGFKQEDPDAKVRGLQTVGAGFMAAAIGAAPGMFGIS